MSLTAQLHKDVDDGLYKGAVGFLNVLFNHVLDSFELFGELDEHRVAGLGEGVCGDLVQESDGFLAGDDGLLETGVVFAVLSIFSSQFGSGVI